MLKYHKGVKLTEENNCLGCGYLREGEFFYKLDNYRYSHHSDYYCEYSRRKGEPFIMFRLKKCENKTKNIIPLTEEEKLWRIHFPRI